MTMTKTSRFLILLLLVITLSGCELNIFKVETEENIGNFTLSIDSDVIEYLNTDELPTFTLNYEGTLYSGKNRTGEYEIAFYNNDDLKLSKIIEKLIQEYEDKNRVVYRLKETKTEAETWINIDTKEGKEKDYIKVKDGKLYNEIAYISLENGLCLSMNYARFKDYENNTYYRWEKTEGIRMVLHYPLMVYYNEENQRNEFVVMPIPNGTIINFDTTTKKVSALLKDDKFIDESYYTYSYFDDTKTFEENKQIVTDYYLNNTEATETSEGIECKFLGNKFLITLNENNFKISLIEYKH